MNKMVENSGADESTLKVVIGFMGLVLGYVVNVVNSYLKEIKLKKIEANKDIQSETIKSKATAEDVAEKQERIDKLEKRILHLEKSNAERDLKIDKLLKYNTRLRNHLDKTNTIFGLFSEQLKDKNKDNPWLLDIILKFEEHMKFEEENN